MSMNLAIAAQPMPAPPARILIPPTSRMPGRTQPRGTRATWEMWKDRKSTRLNSSHLGISYAVFCLKKKNRCSLQPPAIVDAWEGAHQLPPIDSGSRASGSLRSLAPVEWSHWSAFADIEQHHEADPR